MNIEKYYEKSGNFLTFSRAQASKFAKAEAGDFNPIHNVDARRFCVPGDLLFSVALQAIGLYQSMAFEFVQLVTDAHELEIIREGDKFLVQDRSEKNYLEVTVAGEKSDNLDVIRGLSRAYIEFSGVTFPYLLVDLLRQNEVMINPSRPLVMYKSMAFTLDSFTAGEMSLDYTGGTLVAEGKKAEVALPFGIRSGDKQIGHGSKKMLLGGLRPYDSNLMDTLVEDYNAIKSQFATNSQASAG